MELASSNTLLPIRIRGQNKAWSIWINRSVLEAARPSYTEQLSKLHVLGVGPLLCKNTKSSHPIVRNFWRCIDFVPPMYQSQAQIWIVDFMSDSRNGKQAEHLTEEIEHSNPIQRRNRWIWGGWVGDIHLAGVCVKLLDAALGLRDGTATVAGRGAFDNPAARTLRRGTALTFRLAFCPSKADDLWRCASWVPANKSWNEKQEKPQWLILPFANRPWVLSLYKF